MKSITVGYALTGSFCTFPQAVESVKDLIGRGYNVVPIFSETSYATDTRFGKARDWVEQLEAITGNAALHTMVQTEPIGPKKLLDILVVAPCTGNTLAKLCWGVTDTCVTMAVKAHLRNQRPVVLAVSTNDALSGAAKNIGLLLNYRNIYFVPMRQDDPAGKPRSIVADLRRVPGTLEAARRGEQLQPVYLETAPQPLV